MNVGSELVDSKLVPSIFFGEEEDDTLPKTKIAPARRPGLPQKGKDHLLLLMFFLCELFVFRGV